MARNYLEEFIEDEINLLLATSVFNLKKWMNNFILFFIALRIAMIIYALKEIMSRNVRNFQTPHVIRLHFAATLHA
jgi:hypothetical protein